MSKFILCFNFLFNDLYFVDLVVVDLVLCLPKFIVFFSSGFNFHFLSVLAMRLAGKSISKMTCSSGT